MLKRRDKQDVSNGKIKCEQYLSIRFNLLRADFNFSYRFVFLTFEKECDIIISIKLKGDSVPF